MINRYWYVSTTLCCSLFIYLFYRIDNTVINKITVLIVGTHYYSIKEFITNSLPLPQHIIYSLPQGLWIFSISLTSLDFYVSVRKNKFPLIILPIIIALGFEAFQYFHFSNGRFDLIDILYSLLFWGISLFWFRSNSNKENIFSPITNKKIICTISYAIVYLAHVWK